MTTVKSEDEVTCCIDEDCFVPPENYGRLGKVSTLMETKMKYLCEGFAYLISRLDAKQKQASISIFTGSTLYDTTTAYEFKSLLTEIPLSFKLLLQKMFFLSCFHLQKKKEKRMKITFAKGQSEITSKILTVLSLYECRLYIQNIFRCLDRGQLS